MGQCNSCEAKIDDKYKLCMNCNNKISEKNTLQEIALHLKHINWNLGTMVAIMKNDKDLLKTIEDAQKSGD